MKRRDFITLVSGAVAASAIPARGQQGERIRRVGVLAPYAESDDQANARVVAFREGLQRLGWYEGRNVSFIYRSALAPSVERARTLARELIAERADVILAISPPIVTAVQQQTRDIPIVFIGVSDPIGGGFISSLARPGGNVTGLMNYESGITGKWVAMLKEMSPQLSRVAIVGNPKTTAYDYYVQSARSVAPSLAVELVTLRVEGAQDIERSLTTFAKEPNGGLVVLPDSTAILHRALIVSLADQHRLPTVYPFRFFVTTGGLMSYGTVDTDQFRQAASYVNSILRGASPGELPVRTPIRYETVINLKVAKALGLSVPPALLVAADEVIE